MILTSGFEIPMDHGQSQVTWYPLEAYPKTLDTRTTLGRKSWHQFPYLPRWDEDKWWENSFKRKRFSNEVFGLLFVECDSFMFPCFATISWTSQHVVMWDMVYWCCSVAIAQWWHKDGKTEKPCLSMKLHLAEGKQQDMVMNDYIASLPIEGKLRVFHALVWMA